MGIAHRARQPNEKTLKCEEQMGGGAQGSEESTKHLDTIVLKKWFWRKIMGNLGEILLTGAKSS